MQRDVAALMEEKGKQEAQLQGTQKQGELLKVQIDQEKARYSELELILSKERNTQLEQHNQIQNLERDKNELKAEINRLTSKIAGIPSEFITEYRNGNSNGYNASNVYTSEEPRFIINN